MITFHLPYTTLFFLSGALSGVVTVLVLSRFHLYSRRVRLPFAAILLASAVWATAYGFQMGSGGLEAKLAWARLVWVGQIPLASLWLVFALAYEQADVLDRRTLALLAVEPGLALTLALTGAGGGLFVADYRVAFAFDHLVAVPTVGPLYLAHLVYSLVACLASLVVLARLFTKSQGVYRGQVAALLTVLAVPFGGYAMELFGVGPEAGLAVAPLLFSVTSGVSLVALYRFRLFDLTPVAQDAVLAEMRDGVVVLDQYRRVVEANPTVRRLVGSDAASLIGRTAATALPRAADVLELLDDTGPDRVDISVESDGVQRHYEVTATPVSNPDRKRGHLLVFRDVTERHQTEAKFRALVENTQDVVSVVNRDGARRYNSPSVERVLGYVPSQLVGRSVFSLVHPADRDLAREKFRSVVESEGPVRAQFRMRHADGSWRAFEAVYVDLLDDPDVEGVVITSRDVTERHRYEQRLRVLNRVLRHDLRNEMNVVLGNADLLLESDIPAEPKRYASTIKRKAESLVELGERARQIDHTLHHSAEGERPVDVIEPIEKRLDAVREEYPACVVHREYPDERWVDANPLVDSALSNVIENAIEHNDRALPKLWVTVTTGTVDGREMIEVRVADNGPGIPESERDVLARGTETKLEHVSGLGLWLTKWIIDQSSGELRFHDNEPRGTVVAVRLPVADPPKARRATGDRERRSGRSEESGPERRDD